jgi:hypothetical protein
LSKTYLCTSVGADNSVTLNKDTIDPNNCCPVFSSASCPTPIRSYVQVRFLDNCLGNVHVRIGSSAMTLPCFRHS